VHNYDRIDWLGIAAVERILGEAASTWRTW
jgi:hypothetical protein